MAGEKPARTAKRPIDDLLTVRKPRDVYHEPQMSKRAKVVVLGGGMVGRRFSRRVVSLVEPGKREAAGLEVRLGDGATAEPLNQGAGA